MALTSEAQQQAALKRLYEVARAEVRDALLLVDAADSAAVADVIVTYVPVITDRYGLAAATLAADWYEDVREQAEVAGYFQAVMAKAPTQGRYESMAAWASGKDAVEELVSGGVQRILANMHRQTVMRSAWADPQAKGWARFGSGGSSCPMCNMLITRGGVYGKDTALFATHDHCDCGAGPIWKGSAGARQVAAYKASTRRGDEETKAEDDARAKSWINRNLKADGTATAKNPRKDAPAVQTGFDALSLDQIEHNIRVTEALPDSGYKTKYLARLQARAAELR